jgi:snurportin-1
VSAAQFTDRKTSYKKRRNKPNKWADKCMYAELLEMESDSPWSTEGESVKDSLPSDIEHGWVAVAPVPVVKQCLAVTHQSSGVVGVGMSWNERVI